MSAAHQPRRALAEIRWAADPGAITWVGGRTIYHYWPVLSSYFRDLLLPPQRRAEEEKAVWSWREPASQAGISPSDLAAVRKCLEGDQQLLAENLAREIGRLQQAGGTHAQAGIEQLPAIMENVVAHLVGRDDAALAGYVCRTDAGLRLHSWGAFRPARVTYPDGRACEVSGRVLIAGEPAARCEVFLAAENGPPVAQARTDAAGMFRFPEVTAGRYRLQAQAKAREEKFPVPGLAVTVEKEPVADLVLRHDPAETAGAAPASVARWGRKAALAATILGMLAGAVGWWRHASDTTPAVASAATAAGGKKERKPARAAKDRSYKSDTAGGGQVPPDNLPLGPARAGGVGGRSGAAGSTVASASVSSGGVPTADSLVERAIAVPAPAGLPGAASGSPGGATGQPEETRTPGPAPGVPGSEGGGADSTGTQTPSPDEAPGRSASTPEKSVAPQAPPRRVVAVQADRAVPSPAPDRKTKKDPRAEKPPRNQKSAHAPVAPASETPSDETQVETERENPPDAPDSPETPAAASVEAPAAESPTTTAIASNAATSDAAADEASPPSAAAEPSPKESPSERGTHVSTEADGAPLASIPPGEPPASPVASFARALRLAWMPWRCIIISDTIVPTAPVRAGQAGSVHALRAQLRIAQEAAQPRAFRAPEFHGGLVLALPRDLAGPLRWQDAQGRVPPGAMAADGRAEVTWPGTALPAGTRWTLYRADGVAIAEVATAPGAAGATLRLAEGVRATLWVVLAAPEEASAAPSRFVWRRGDGGPLPPAYAEAAGLRFQLSLDQPLTGAPLQRLALVDPESGWALVGGIRLSLPALAGGQR